MLTYSQKQELAKELKKMIPQLTSINDSSRGGSTIEISHRGTKEYLSTMRSHQQHSSSSIR